VLFWQPRVFVKLHWLTEVQPWSQPSDVLIHEEPTGATVQNATAVAEQLDGTDVHPGALVRGGVVHSGPEVIVQ
jgi:hypothetical protein